MSERKTNKVCGKMYLRIEGVLASPLLIGSGEDNRTDMDVLVRADGTPYIPGTSLAGVLKEDFDRRTGPDGEPYKNEYLLFGSAQFEKKDTSFQSRIFVYDAELNCTADHLILRDGVKLNQHKVSEHMAKFEMQAVPAGTAYTMILEIVVREELLKEHKGDLEKVWKQDQDAVLPALAAMQEGFIRLGARSSRGFGRIRIEHILYKKFDLRKSVEYEKWLDWNWDQEDAFEEGEALSAEDILSFLPEKNHCLCVPFTITNTLLIRQYRAQQDKKLDYGQLTGVPDSEGKPQAVIPGSSMAGAVRSYLAYRVMDFAGGIGWREAQKALAPFFGTWVASGENEKLSKSAVIFEEAVIQKGKLVTLTRNAVDRFTGGTAMGALFSEQVCVGGKLVLQVRWTEKEGLDQDVLCGLLLWAVFGLENGFLPIGGETGVGRGILQRTGDILMDGKMLEEGRCRRAAAQWCMGLNNGGRRGD